MFGWNSLPHSRPSPCLCPRPSLSQCPSQCPSPSHLLPLPSPSHLLPLPSSSLAQLEFKYDY